MPILLVLHLLLGLLLGAPLSAAVLGFDEITEITDRSVAVTSYGGLVWTNTYVLHRDAASGTGYAAGVVSGGYAAFNGLGQRASFAAADPFHFYGVSATSATRDGSLLRLNGYRDGVLVDSRTATLSSSTPLWVTLEWWVDTVTFIAGPSPVVLDDLRVTPVPLAGSGWFAALSLLGLVTWRGSG